MLGYRCWWFVVSVVLCNPYLDAETTLAKTAEELAARANAAADRGDNAEAIQLATQAIELDPKYASAYKTRGREFFRVARIGESIADLDKYVELMPEQAPRQWERGIAYYYAGRFKQGAEQFELYQTFDGHDVENSVWRFLCMVPLVGVDRAQSAMLAIENDRRVPMMQVFDLFRGKCQPDDVLVAARAGKLDEVTLASQLFYAHLYLGLWFDANGKKQESKRNIDLAADEKLKTNPRINRYMWDVGCVHQKLQRGELKTGRP